MGAQFEVRNVKHPFRQPPEEARLPTFQHAPPWTEPGRAGQEQAPKLQQIILIAPGSVQQEQRGQWTRDRQLFLRLWLCGHKMMNKIGECSLVCLHSWTSLPIKKCILRWPLTDTRRFL